MEQASFSKKVLGALIFTWFYLGAAFYGTLILPFVGLGASRPVRWRKRQRSVSGVFIRVLDAMRRAGIVDFDPRLASARADGPARIVVANHPSTLDVVAVLSIYREACVLVKQSNWHHPLLRPLFRWCGHVRSTDGSLEDTKRMMAEVQDRLGEGLDVVIFPEGTRSPPHELGPLQKGAFAIALHSGSGLEPLIIECEPPVLHRHAPWHALPPSPARYRVRPLPCMQPGDTTTRRLHREITALYLRELGLEDVSREATPDGNDLSTLTGAQIAATSPAKEQRATGSE